MQQRSQIRLIWACLLVLCLSSLATAQLPNLGQIAGQASQLTAGGNDATTAQAQQTQQGNGQGQNNQNTPATATGGRNNQATSTGGTATTNRGQQTNGPATSASTPSITGTFPSNVVTSATPILPESNFDRLSGAPTLQGVGIPTMVVPFTATAPFMQKSSLPEGTVFIAVGAVLAFLGFCVIAWRALVAWSINRSVKRAAMASILASETKNGNGWKSNPFKPAGGFYHQAPGGSTLDLNERHDKSHGTRVKSAVIPPANTSGLFFSPTASNVSGNSNNIPMANLNTPGNRSSSFLPAGYYASPSSQLGSGNTQTTIGGTGQGSPSLQAHRLSNNRLSHIQLAPSLRDGAGNRASMVRPMSHVSNGGGGGGVAYASQGGLHPAASASSMQVGTGHGDDLPGSRAPSAYLEDLFESHGNPPAGVQGHR